MKTDVFKKSKWYGDTPLLSLALLKVEHELVPLVPRSQAGWGGERVLEARSAVASAGVAPGKSGGTGESSRGLAELLPLGAGRGGVGAEGAVSAPGLGHSAAGGPLLGAGSPAPLESSGAATE